MESVTYIKTDKNKIINEATIKWVKKMDDCLYVCTKPDGCLKFETHQICKEKNPNEYDKFNKFFDK